jgi:hypothetical protein
LRNQGKWNEAEVLEREVLATRQKILGLEHPDTIMTLHNFACALHAKGQTEEALQLSLQATQLAEKVIGLNHPHTIVYLERLESFCEITGRIQDASSVRQKLDLIHKSH